MTHPQTPRSALPDARPLQGLSAYLRCDASGMSPQHPSYTTLRQWADEVDAVAGQPTDRALIEQLVAALEDTESRLKLLVDSERHKLLDVVARDNAIRALTAATECLNQPQGRPVPDANDLQAKLDEFEKLHCVGETIRDCYPDHTGTIDADVFIPEGTKIYIRPSTNYATVEQT